MVAKESRTKQKSIIELLEYLQNIIETSSKMPITGKVLIDKKEAIDLLDEIINRLPDEFKKAQWVVEEKERILSEAINDSEAIKKESMDMLRKQIENHDITKEAIMRAEEIIASAQRDAKAMRLGARDYADEVLSQMEKEINEKGQLMLTQVKNEVESFLTTMDSELMFNANTIRENIKELRGIK